MRRILKEIRPTTVKTVEVKTVDGMPSSRNYTVIKSVNLPNNAGTIMKLRDDPKPNESENDRSKRHEEFVRNHLREGCFTILVSPTLIKASNDAEVSNMVKKIVAGKNLSIDESNCLVPGHISIHTLEQSLSHRRPGLQTSNPIKKDVSDTMKQCYDTYIAIIPKTNFPQSSLNAEIGSFNLGAVGDGDNCSTAVQKALLNKKDRKAMNPLATLNMVADAAVVHTKPTDKQRDEATALFSEIGVNRQLVTVAGDYRKNLSDELAASISPPKQETVTQEHPIQEEGLNTSNRSNR